MDEWEEEDLQEKVWEEEEGSGHGIQEEPHKDKEDATRKGRKNRTTRRRRANHPNTQRT